MMRRNAQIVGIPPAIMTTMELGFHEIVAAKGTIGNQRLGAGNRIGSGGSFR